ncbi:MAG: hypothetical protein Q9200_007362, partial [Gallowayella weberi]
MSSSGLGPFETLLLLQGLQTSDSDVPSIVSVSESLKARNKTLRNGSSNVDCFEPKSLELLFLRLLKEEAKLESQRLKVAGNIQDEQSNPRKRKLSNAPLETLEEALHYRHLIPQLATRVYDSHRESTIKAIEDEERKYRLLEKDIQEIERGDWDVRLQPQDAISRKDSKSVSSIQTLLQDESDTAHSASKAANGLTTILPPLHAKSPTQNSPASASICEGRPQVVPYVKGDPAVATPSGTGDLPQESVVPAAVSPKRARQPLYPPYQLPSNVPRPPSEPKSAENGIPFLPPPQQNQQGYSVASPPPDLHRRQSSQATNIAPSPTTRPHQTPLQHPERSSGSPIILPPPPGMLRSTSSSSGPLDSFADMTGHRYASNAMPSPRPPQSSGGPTHPVQLPIPPKYVHEPYQYPPYDNRSPYPNTYAPYPPGPLPSYQSPNHTHVPSYQYPAHHTAQQSHYPPRQPYQSPVQPYPQYSPYRTTSPYTPHGQVASPYPQYPPPPRPYAPQTPIYTSNSHKRPPKPSPINTSVTSTKWKNTERHGEAGSPKSPIPPGPEAFSPLSEKAPSPIPEPPQMQVASVEAQEELSSLTTEDLQPPSHQSGNVKRGRGRPRGASSRGRGGRAASIASSALQARSRSPSVASVVDELSLGAPTSAGNRPSIKPEPPATPARDSSASIPPIVSVEDGNRKSTRQRRGTLRGIEATAESTRTSTKRKRTVDTSEAESRPVLLSEFEKQKESLAATHILASRNFPRTSATLLNDITGHKLASIFAKPLTEREAPGYPSLIYRPQDLKSIKQAITTGNRALTAFIDQDRKDDDEITHDIIQIVGAGEADARIWVRKHEDFMPPKGIVNSAQLEKEVMRVFANAVMFNPDPKRILGPASRTRAKVRERHIPLHLDDRADDDAEDEDAGEDDGDDGSEGEGGVVIDTKEMFEDVERVVGQWRAAERAAGRCGGLARRPPRARAAGRGLGDRPRLRARDRTGLPVPPTSPAGAAGAP